MTDKELVDFGKKYFGQLGEAMEQVENAKLCVRQNRGYDKDMAKEGLDHLVGEQLIPAIINSIWDVTTEDVIKIAKIILKSSGRI